MQACLRIAPSMPDALAALEAVALGLVAVNVLWIRRQIELGRDPPCCTACAEPPWVPGGGVRWVDFHGREPAGWCREYWDAPTMFARAEGTCFDAAAYDAARRISKGKRGTVRVRAIESNLPGLQAHAWVETGDGEWQDPTADMSRENTVLRRGTSGAVLVRANVGASNRIMDLQNAAGMNRSADPSTRRIVWSPGPLRATGNRLRQVLKQAANVGGCGCNEGR